MRNRELPSVEWAKLNGTDLAEVWPTLDPACTKIAVVEQDGEIIGCVATILTLNAHGLWVSKPHRGKAAVFRRLRHGLTGIAFSYGTSAVMTSAEEPHMHKLLAHLGATKLKGAHYYLPLEAH